MATMNVQVIASLVDKVTRPANDARKSVEELGRSERKLPDRDERGRFTAGRRGRRRGALDINDFRDSLRFANTITAASRGLDRFGAKAAVILREPVRQAAQYGKSVAEVTTLVDEATFSTQSIRDMTKSAAATFGGPITKQSKALYDIISAGAGSAAEAQTILDTSNRLAVGGITDVATAADGLTSVLNAYGKSAASAGSVADTFFATVKAGKTTVPELARAIGRVAPIAASLNVPFKEVGAVLATLTAGGLSTAESVTALSGALTTFQKPADLSKEAAKALGFDLSSTKIKTDGFVKSIKELSDRAERMLKPGGTSNAFEAVFRNIRGLVAATGLATNNFRKFDQSLDTVEMGAGAASEAFRKIARQDFHQLELASAAMTGMSTSIGEQLIPIVKEAAGELVTMLKPIRQFTEENPTFVRTAATTGAKVLAVTTAVSAGLLSLGAGITIVTTLTKVVVGLGAALIAIASAGPLAALGALAAGFGTLGVGVLAGRSLGQAFLDSKAGKLFQEHLGVPLAKLIVGSRGEGEDLFTPEARKELKAFRMHQQRERANMRMLAEAGVPAALRAQMVGAGFGSAGFGHAVLGHERNTEADALRRTGKLDIKVVVSDERSPRVELLPSEGPIRAESIDQGIAIHYGGAGF